MANVTGKICAAGGDGGDRSCAERHDCPRGIRCGRNLQPRPNEHVDATSVLTGSSAGQLKVQNNSTAAATFGVFGLINPTATTAEA